MRFIHDYKFLTYIFKVSFEVEVLEKHSSGLIKFIISLLTSEKSMIPRTKWVVEKTYFLV